MPTTINDYSTTETQKKKVGRPRQKRHGEMLWIPVDCVDFVKTYLETARQKQLQEDNNEK